MSEETSTESHLSVVMTTDQDQLTQTTGVTSSSSRGAALYFQCFVFVIGVIALRLSFINTHTLPVSFRLLPSHWDTAPVNSAFHPLRVGK